MVLFAVLFAESESGNAQMDGNFDFGFVPILGLLTLLFVIEIKDRELAV